MKKFLVFLCAIVMFFGMFGVANATTITSYYGDSDGFGVGITSGTMNPEVSNQEAGEAAYTDMQLIADGNYSGPAFAPTGNFEAFLVDGPIISTTLTLRTGAFDSAPSLDFPNRIYLDGLLVDSSFIDSFSTDNSDLVETRSWSLDTSFFSLLSDGVVSLDGTHIAEAGGSGSFQVDFLRLDIITESASVPEPATILLLGTGLVGLAGFRRKFRKKVV